jgi:uncharacterized membrane protein YgdD (TMEM256/DUF423 family)
MEPDDHTKRRLTILAWLFIAPTVVSFVGLAIAFVGLVARHSKSSAKWGIWCSVVGWSLAVGGLCLRQLARRLEKKWRN